MIEPLLRQLKTILGLDFLLRGFVVEPHTLVGRSCGRKKKGQSKANRKKALHIGFLREGLLGEIAVPRGATSGPTTIRCDRKPLQKTHAHSAESEHHASV